MNENTKQTWCRQMKTWSRHDADKWRHGANTMQTHNIHVRNFLNCEPATKKSLVHIIYKSISWQGVYYWLVKVFVHYNINSLILLYGRKKYNRVPCYPTSGPHHFPSLLLPLSDHYSKEGAFVWCTLGYPITVGLT